MMLQQQLLIFFALVVSSVRALSCMAPPGPISFQYAMHRADFVVKLRTWRDITQQEEPPKPVCHKVTVGNATETICSDIQIRPYGIPEPQYLMGYVQKVFKGKLEKGRVVVRGQVACGVGKFEENTSYLLFGRYNSISSQKVKGFVGEVSVFTPMGWAEVGQHYKPFRSLTMAEKQQLWRFDPKNQMCEPSDCYEPVATSLAMCPDKVGRASSKATCTFQKDSCNWNVVTFDPCPTCSTADDCDTGLVCNKDGYCAQP